MRSPLRLISLASLLLTLPVSIFPPVPHLLIPTPPALAQTPDTRKVEAEKLLRWGLQQWEAGYAQAAVHSLEKALILYQDLRDRFGEGRSLMSLSWVYLGLGDNTKAVKLSQKALAIAKELNNPKLEESALIILEIAQKPANSLTSDHLQKAESEAIKLLQEGVVQFQNGQFKLALQSWQKALVIYQKIEDKSGQSDALSNLGIVYDVLGNYTEAIEAQEQSLAIARETKNLKREARSLNRLAITYQSLGSYAKAIEYYERSLAIAQKFQDLEAKGTTLNNLGNVYFFLGNYSKAIEYQKQSLAIAREIRDRDGEGRILGNLANTYLSLNNYINAIEYQKQSLAIAREIKDRLWEGQALGNLGIAYDALGNHMDAIQYQLQSLEIAREIKDRLGEGQALGALGSAYYSLTNYDKAIEYQKQSLVISQEVKNLNGEGIALQNLGIALFKSGNLGAAVVALFDSIVVYESIRQTGARTDANKVSIFELQYLPYRTLQQLLVAQNKPDVALEIAERGRARAFVELLSSRLKERPEAANLTPATQNLIPTFAQLQQIVKAQNATLVQYSIIADDFKLQGKEETRESELYIWVIQSTGNITFRKADLKTFWQQQNTSLAELVTTSREGIGARGRAGVRPVLTAARLQQRREQQTRQLRQLHQLLIEPIADLLPKDPKQRVIFVPQEALFLVPFPALQDKNGKFLIEQHTILTAPSIQVLELTHQQKKGVRNQKSGGVLVVGNPTMPKVRTEAGGEFEQLSNLPGAEQEAEEIAGLLKTKAIIGDRATKSAILKQLSQAHMIHFATHGLLDDFKGWGVPGAIALAPDGTGETNDGLLTSDEILDLKLNAELVVLSACDTGRGKITGDGVIGLSRSLITAGVPSIIVSLWKVPDDATALLMTEFYKNLQQNPNKAEALRQAMLTTKAKHPDPLDWAAFTLIGEAE